MNALPAMVAFKSFAAQSMHAAAVVNEAGADPGSHSFYTTLEEPGMQPGSWIVSEAEVKSATGAELKGWHEAAKKEFLESFMEIGSVATASRNDIARAGGQSKALPMKVVWTQKPEKKKVQRCGLR